MANDVKCETDFILLRYAWGLHYASRITHHEAPRNEHLHLNASTGVPGLVQKTC